jgi:metal-dependent amidase/aminoacylase/carboxypeptidase family protein
MFEIGKKTASAEMVVEVPPTSSEVRGALRVQNDQIVKKMIGDMENVAQSAAMQTIAKKGGSIVDT